ncbi:hypothetical protein AAFF_G00379620, partial [Aldrovandia affinis]
VVIVESVVERECDREFLRSILDCLSCLTQIGRTPLCVPTTGLDSGTELNLDIELRITTTSLGLQYRCDFQIPHHQPHLEKPKLLGVLGRTSGWC